MRTRFQQFAAVIALALSVVTYAASDTPHAGEGLVVHSLFQSNMVVQRGKPVDVRGWSTPGEKVTVTFAGETATATAGKDRLWKATLPALEASSEPATMTIQGDSGTITLENVLVGDVWVLGGQSNMQWPISRTRNGNLEVASANFPEIRLLTIPQIFGSELKQNFPRADEFSKISGKETTTGDWAVCTPDTVAGMSAIGYVMARRIHMATGVPIGVINTSRGGTTVEAWAPMAKLSKLDTPEVKARLEVTHKKLHHVPGNCFASVISPIAGFPVKGVIFHQGYNNCFSGVRGARMYRDVFPEMIRGWREAFNDTSLPFGILSQCTAGQKQSLDNFLPLITDIGARVREAQYQTFLEFYNAGDKNIGFVSTYDLRHQSYHPRVKIPAGERAAAWALATQYGMDSRFRWVPPMLQDMKAEDGTLVLTFDESVGGPGDGAALEGFAIAGEDMKFQPAEVSHKVIGKKGRKVQYDSKVLVLRSPLVSEPVHFRYAWARNPMGNIRLNFRFGNEVVLPTQRSDQWTNADLLKALTGKTAEDPGQLDRGENNALRGALADEDQRRRVEEAKALVLKGQEISAK